METASVSEAPGTASGTIDEERLRTAPGTFQFFQAVLIMERLAENRSSVGRFTRPADESVRFSSHPSLSFPPSEIADVDFDGHVPPRMTVNFMGLIGPQGVLPHVYTTRVIERISHRDTALRDFLDIFQHRFVSLFYRAWRKHRFELDVEEGGRDVVADHLLDVIGVTRESLTEEVVPPDLLGAYAGLLAPMQRSALGLEQLLADHFRVPVEVQQFVGGWYPMRERDWCQLGEDEPATRLGAGAALGDEIRDQQARVRVRVGPLRREDFDKLLPGGRNHERLRSLVRWYGHDQFQFEVQLILDGPEVPSVVLGAEGEDIPALGLRTWIRSAPRSRVADETLFRL